MLITTNQIYHCQLPGHNSKVWKVTCHLQIFQPHAEVQTVMITDMGFEMGWFIPHLMERLAEQIVKEFYLDPDKTIWLEHYAPHGDRPSHTDFSQVTFEWHQGKAANPQWIAIAPETAKALIREDLLVV